MDTLIIVLGIVLLVSFFLVFLLLGRPSPQSALLAEVAGQVYQSGSENVRQGWLNTERLSKPFGRLRGLFGGGPSPQLVRRLVLAGYRKPFHADIFAGTKLLFPVIAGLAVALWVRDNVIFLFLLAVVVAFFFPDFWLNYAISKRREHIKRSLPDALDLLAICMEAGLGLDQAIVRIGQA